MSTITTTLRAIRASNASPAAWQTLLNYLGKTEADKEPLSFETILEACGWNACLWALRSLPVSEHWRLHLAACDFAGRAHIAARHSEKRTRVIRPDYRVEDLRAVFAIPAKRRWVFGLISDEELAIMWSAAWAAYASCKENGSCSLVRKYMLYAVAAASGRDGPLAASEAAKNMVLFAGLYAENEIELRFGSCGFDAGDVERGMETEAQQEILWRWLDADLTKEQAQEMVLGGAE